MLTLADVKPYLGILDEDDPGDDALIQQELDAARDYIARYLRRDLDAAFAPDFPPSLLRAHRLLTAHYYLHREAVSAQARHAVPLGVKDILADFRDFT